MPISQIRSIIRSNQSLSSLSKLHSHFSNSNRIGITRMSSSSSSSKKLPEIISVDELKIDAKFLKLERINWKDEEGKEVSFSLLSL